MMTKDDILQHTALETEIVNVPDFGDVCVRELTGSDREQVYNLFVGVPEGRIPHNYRATLCAFGLVDEHGRRLFADGDVDAIAALPFDFLKVVAAAVERLSGLGVDPEESAGNSEGAASD